MHIIINKTDCEQFHNDLDYRNYQRVIRRSKEKKIKTKKFY